MPLFWVVLKYCTYALVACWAAVKRPGTGPLMSEELPMVMVLSVIPGWFLKPAQEPAFTPGTATAPPPVDVPPAEPVAAPPVLPEAAVAAPPAGASTAVLPESPVPASEVLPVVSEALPEPRLPET